VDDALVGLYQRRAVQRSSDAATSIEAATLPANVQPASSGGRRVVKVVILAGGLGTRLSEETASRPKPMVEIGERPILSAAIVHHQFETIHPFADGNGRTGRMLSLWELYRRGFDSHHIFSIDEFYWEDRPRYYAALENVQAEEGELTSWLEYNAEGLRVTLEQVWTRIQKLTAHAGKSKLVLRPKQEQLLHLLREHKALTPREIWAGIGVSKQGALDLLRPLIKAGLVRRIGTKKTGRYVLR
jgi:Fic family protein